MFFNTDIIPLTSHMRRVKKSILHHKMNVEHAEHKSGGRGGGGACTWGT